LFWTNDEGVFALPQRDVAPERYIQLTRHEQRHELYRRAIKLGDGRLDVPRRTPNLFAINHWIANAPGTTLFMPVSDVTRQCITAMLLYFDEPHRYYIHDPRLAGDPLRPLVRAGWFDDSHGVDLWDFERWQMVDINGVEQGLRTRAARSGRARPGRPTRPVRGCAATVSRLDGRCGRRRAGSSLGAHGLLRGAR
jgi:hypothetical protein